MNVYSISEAAARYHIPESTIRYYEKKGLLPFIERDKAGRRLFSEDQMTLLGTIMCLKNTNMPISGIKQYVDWILEGESTLERRLKMMNDHRKAVLDEIALMTDSIDGIDYKIARYAKQIQERKHGKGE
ncbi:MerR family transcriptional regulator [Cohnella sp. JJ-181]|uniref:MerR family transcriptional regulator n=1 Tax=Cohnella rhizoplanae TaxID=2974897 RepID=UPI0022FF7E7F|nr:MerR family transcriptional regulator [Cohnella sp. JJ-181]CAI6060565.1 putative HTH-type transcriptional regulator [Cohnella sp. JJ-181]